MKLWKLLFSVLVFLIACSKDDEPLVQRIFEIEAFDVGNEGNASDIRVTFNIESIAGISEFRIMVFPSKLSEGFSKTQSLKLSSDSYTDVPITSTDPKYSIRLSQISGVEGEQVENNKEYVIKILMIGDQFNQLSILRSNKIILIDQPIYNGYYKANFHLGFLQVDGIPPPNFKNEYVQIIGTDDIKYFGKWGAFDGASNLTASVQFTVEDGVINNYVRDVPSSRGGCNSLQPNESTGPALFGGRVLNDLTLTISCTDLSAELFETSEDIWVRIIPPEE